MAGPRPGHRYYAITLTASRQGNIQWQTQTCFAGFTDTAPRREVRVPCEVIPDRMIAIWKDLAQEFIVVTDHDDLGVFLVAGGNALVDIDLATAYLDFVKTGIQVAFDGCFSTIEVSRVPAEHSQHAPTPKARMEVIKRDGRRCVICGRRPADCVDVELNVHHIRPWADGGLTKRNNLITICRTCHKGLDPHFDWELYGLIPEPQFPNVPSAQELATELQEGVDRYRAKVLQFVREQRREDIADSKRDSPR